MSFNEKKNPVRVKSTGIKPIKSTSENFTGTSSGLKIKNLLKNCERVSAGLEKNPGINNEKTSTTDRIEVRTTILFLSIISGCKIKNIAKIGSRIITCGLIKTLTKKTRRDTTKNRKLDS